MFVAGVGDWSSSLTSLADDRGDVSSVPCARGSLASRLLQNARRDLCKNRSFAEDDGGDCYIVANLYIFMKSGIIR